MSQHALKSTVVAGPWTAPKPASPSPRTPERRRNGTRAASPEELRAGLTDAQQATLETLQAFRWRLAFVRRPLFQTPIPVLFDLGDTRYIVIREDGSLDEHPSLRLRD